MFLKIFWNNFWNFSKLILKVFENNFRKMFEVLFEIFRIFFKWFSKFFYTILKNLGNIFSKFFYFYSEGFPYFALAHFLKHPNPLKKFSPTPNFLYNFITYKIFYSANIFIPLFRIHFFEHLCFLAQLIF